MIRKKILVVGELNVDLILNEINGTPKVGEEIIAEKMNLVMGSSSAIFACNISILGCDVSFSGMVGKDFFGDFIVRELQIRNIDTTLIQYAPNKRTGLTVVLNYDQNRANVTHCGAMEELEINKIPLKDLGLFDHLHVSSYFLQKGIQPDLHTLFEDAKEKGLTTSLDIQWDPDNNWNFPYQRCLPFVDVFLPNESELCKLAREEDYKIAMEKIGALTPLLIVKRGLEGAVAYEKGKVTSSEPFLHNSFVDAIGAGDSFNAGFLYKYLNGYSLEDSLLFGNIAGSISTTEAGGTGAFENIQAFNKKVSDLFKIIL